MLSDQYQRWDRFDVDAAIAEADASALRDERMRGRTKARQALEALDAKVLARAQELVQPRVSAVELELVLEPARLQSPARCKVPAAAA